MKNYDKRALFPHRFSPYFLCAWGALALVPASFATSYFVDSGAGSDASVGTSSSTPWKSLTKVNATTFSAGDKIFFKAGGSWVGQLAPKGSGATGNPIVIDMYGTGAKPSIAANGTKNNAVFFFNQQHWEINNLDVSNNAGSSASDLGDFRGIYVTAQNAGPLQHFYIKNCVVHNVTGHVFWISGDTANNSTGVAFKMGWDASKRTGGIVVDTMSSSTKTKFDDILVEGCTIKDCSFGGIIVKQWDGSVHWGIRASASDSNFSPHTHVTLRGNYITQGGTSFGCNGIYMTGTRDGLIEDNVVSAAGTSAIECYYADAITIQKNETFGTVRKAAGADFNGIDPDKATTNMLIQYNYIHNNGDGILLCEFSFGSVTVRYNILQNNSRYGIYLHSDPAARAEVYNNVVYTNKSGSRLVFGFGSSLSALYNLRNNIFMSTVSVPALTTGGGISYDANLFSGAGAVGSHAISSNPLFVGPGSGGTGGASGTAFASLSGYKLQAGSPAINKGVSISSNGGSDFFGSALYNGAADIGPHEFGGSPGGGGGGGGGSGTTLSAESGVVAGGTTIESLNLGFNGSAYVNFPASGGTLTLANVTSAGGSKTLSIRYALGATAGRTGSLTVNGVTTPVTFSPTGAWTTWQTINVTVVLNNSATNTIQLASTGADLANVDEITVP